MLEMRSIASHNKEPKGITEDVCDEIKSEYDDWESDAHSSSYFDTLKEL
jgi:hypothetical protein